MRFLRWLALAFAPLVLWATPAAAQYVVKDGNGVERTFCSFTVLSVHYGCQVLHGSNGGVPQALAIDGSGRLTVLQGGSWTFGLTGAIPAGANTIGTVNLGTIGGGATEAAQTAAQASFTDLVTAAGAPGDPACGTDDGACSELALMKRSLQKLTVAVAHLAAIQTAAEDVTPAAVSGPLTDAQLRAAVVPTAPQAQTTGGCTPSVYRSLATNNATNIKASAGTLCKLVALNSTSTIYYVRLYNLSAAPTCSSGTGEVASYPIPANTSGAGIAVPIGPFGEAYSTGLGFCLTGGGAANDNTSAATGVTLSYSFK